MKIKDYIFALFVTVVICVTILAQNNGKTITDMSNKIDALKSQISGTSLKIDNIQINKELLDKIDTLTRDNEQKDMIIASQKAQIKEFDKIFEGVKK